MNPELERKRPNLQDDLISFIKSRGQVSWGELLNQEDKLRKSGNYPGSPYGYETIDDYRHHENDIFSFVADKKSWGVLETEDKAGPEATIRYISPEEREQRGRKEITSQFRQKAEDLLGFGRFAGMSQEEIESELKKLSSTSRKK